MPRIKSAAVNDRKNDLLKLLKPLVLKTTRMMITLETIVKMVTAKTRILDADNRGENVAEDDEDDDDDEDEDDDDDDKDSIEKSRSSEDVIFFMYLC